MSFRFFDDNASGSIINRVTGDVQSVRAFIDGVLLQGGIMLLSLGVYMVYMLRAHVALTLACLAPTPLIWLVTSLFSRRTSAALTAIGQRRSVRSDGAGAGARATAPPEVIGAGFAAERLDRRRTRVMSAGRLPRRWPRMLESRGP